MPYIPKEDSGTRAAGKSQLKSFTLLIFILSFFLDLYTTEDPGPEHQGRPVHRWQDRGASGSYWGNSALFGPIMAPLGPVWVL